MHDISLPRTEGVVSPTVPEETRARERSLSAQVVEDWADVLFTVAGRMGRGLVPYLVLGFAGIELVSPDIVGIRSAACREGVRTSEIDAAAVRRFRDGLWASSRSRVATSRQLDSGSVPFAARQ